jgi:Domain of unknown function (DUF2382)
VWGRCCRLWQVPGRPHTRLRKYVVTEDVQETVSVQREEVRVEREPITDANVDAATSGRSTRSPFTRKRW